MRRALQILALTLALGAAVTWLATGANRGWTKTSYPVRTVDEVTGLEAIEYRKGFAPGVELLGAALAGAGILGAGSLLPGRKRSRAANRNY